MSFAWPHLLWLLAVPVVLSAWDGARRRRATRETAAKILTGEAGARTLSFAPGASRAARPRVWLWFGLALGIVALARPQWGRVEEPVFDQSREILLAVDLSRSMLAQDVKPSRLERAKLLIQSLLERLKGERVGLLVFSGTGFLQSPLSADYEVLREFLPALGPDYLPEGGTNYTALLDAAVNAFSATNSADRFLIILSDGEANDDTWQPLVQKLKEKNVRVIGLGIGTDAGAMIPDGEGAFVKDERGAVVLSRLEKGTLQQLAQATGGAYTDASAWVNLGDLLNQTVEAGRKGQFVEKSNVRLIERFQWPLVPAVLCFLLSFWREFPVRPRPRDLRLASAAPRAATTAAAALAFLCCFVSPRARAGATAEPTLSNLGPMVARLSASATPPSARDWSEFANETLRWGQRLQAGQQPVPAGPVQDALAATELGEKLDSKLADWPKLRRDLETLLEKPEPPPQQPQPQQNQQQNKDEQQKEKDQKDSSQNSSGQPPPDQQKQQQQQQRDQPDAKNNDSSSSPDQQNQSAPEQNPPEKKSGQSAFGDMQKDQPQPPPPQPSGDTQTVGGAREKKNEAGQPADPALALPLQKLDQLRAQDSPARLQKLMEGDASTRPAPTNGKNW